MKTRPGDAAARGSSVEIGAHRRYRKLLERAAEETAGGAGTPVPRKATSRALVAAVSALDDVADRAGTERGAFEMISRRKDFGCV